MSRDIECRSKRDCKQTLWMYFKITKDVDLTAEEVNELNTAIKNAVKNNFVGSKIDLRNFELCDSLWDKYDEDDWVDLSFDVLVRVTGDYHYSPVHYWGDGSADPEIDEWFPDEGFIDYVDDKGLVNDLSKIDKFREIADLSTIETKVTDGLVEWDFVVEED